MKRARTVLVIEDSVEEWPIYRTALRALGCECAFVNQADLASDAAKEHDYALILLDLDLDCPSPPAPDSITRGRYVFDSIRRVVKVPVVVVTAFDRTAKGRRAIDAMKPDGVIPKPCSQESFQKALGRFLTVTETDEPEQRT